MSVAGRGPVEGISSLSPGSMEARVFLKEAMVVGRRSGSSFGVVFLADVEEEKHRHPLLLGREDR